MNDGVRCGNCGKKLAEMLVDGLLIMKCRGCGSIVTIDKRLDKGFTPALR